MTWLIERMQLERDLEDVIALEQASFTNPTTREMIAWETRHSDVSHIFVMRARPGSPAIAFCAVWILFDELHINTLAVDPASRQRGLGAILLRYVLAEALRRGATKATLEVRESNLAARRLYERFGFEVRGVRPGYYRDPVEDALILWRYDLNNLDGSGGAPPEAV